ncbi:hypothetical protein AAMO2058_000906600 [Amorphochlora amoebiformis]
MELKAAKQKIHYQALAMTLKDHTMESILQESKLSDYIKPFAEGQLTLEAVLTESSDAKRLKALLEKGGMTKRGHYARLHRKLCSLLKTVEELKKMLLEKAQKSLFGGQLSINSVIVVEKAGAGAINGEYVRDSNDYHGRPMWHKVDNKDMYIWYRRENGGHWRLGGTNDYYYIAEQDSTLPPLKGWKLASEAFNGAYRMNPNSMSPVPELWAKKDTRRDKTTPHTIRLTGAGTKEVNGDYKLCGQYHNKVQFNQCKDPSFYIWFRMEHGGHWRIGKTNDYYYMTSSNGDLPPTEPSSWELGSEAFGGSYARCNNNAVGPNPKLTFFFDDSEGEEENPN